MNIKETRLKNLIELIGTFPSQAAFSKKVGIDSTQLSQIKNPSNSKNLGEKLARKIEAALNLPFGWMDRDRIAEQAGFYNVEDAQNLPSHQVPVISWVQAGNAAEVIDNFEPGDAEEWVTPLNPPREHTYALRVSGESMAPTFTPGMILVVEPTMCADPGDYVIAKNGDHEATFKQYIMDGGQPYLKPINPQFPVKEMGTYEIIGVVRDAIMKLK